MKRFMDCCVAGVGLMVAAPLLIFLFGVVRWRLGTPVLFRQQRPGLDARPFELLKLRTMREAVGPDGAPLPDVQRLTSLGQWLRKTSLDELPSLWNVLKGDMSLVGPRPLLMEYLPRYTSEQARRHDVRPGITGWAQINGRNALTWEEKFALDVWYVDHQSVWLDLRILARTVGTVLGAKGVSQKGHATMEKFLGSGQP